MLPTFVVIGAMKTGSSSFATYLGAHPDVFMSTPKEPSYFAMRWAKGQAWYESLFEGAGGASARGEASTAYTKSPVFPDVPRRMAAIMPDAKLIYLVRHPVLRIRSQYVHNCAHRGERRPIGVAVRRNPDYLAFSRHAYQLDRFLEHFPREQVLVLSSEQLRARRESVLKEAFQFIGVDPDVAVPNLDAELNRGADKRRTPLPVEWTQRALGRAGILQRMPMRWRRRAFDAAKVGRIRVDVPPDLARWIWDELAEDRERFYGMVPPDFPRWDPP
jgi:hypothetical protein